MHYLNTDEYYIMLGIYSLKERGIWELGVILGGYDIQFVSAICNVDNTQTWTYTVTKIDDPTPEISNWALELCSCPEQMVIDSSGPGTVVVGQGQPCLVGLSNTIKWEDLSNANVDGVYTFTLCGCFQQELVAVAVKAGEPCHIGEITGPSCMPLVTTTTTTTTMTTTTMSTTTMTTTKVPPQRGVSFFN